MLLVGLEPHQVHHVDDPYLELGECIPEYCYSRQCLQCRCVSCAGHDYIGLCALVGGSPLPDADSLGAVLYCLLHGEPLGPRVLGCNHHVDIIAAPDAVVIAGEEAVGVWRQVEAHHVGLLVGHMVKEARVLMCEAVVVLLPNVGSKDVGEG